MNVRANSRRWPTVDEVYGIRAWREWGLHSPSDLRAYMTPREDVCIENERLRVSSFVELQQVVSFLNVMNKGQILLFRGQSADFDLLPTLYREIWHPPPTAGVESVALGEQRQHVIEQLDTARDLVRAILKGQLPRWRPFEREPVAGWAVIQHYNIWPTPALDLTSSLRVAASFALGLRRPGRSKPSRSTEGARHGYVYVLGFDRIISDVMKLWRPAATGTKSRPGASGVNVIRLSALCPPSTVRPHLQEGFLLTFPLPETGVPPATPSEAARTRLVAVLELADTRARRFWTADFPQHSEEILEDKLADEFQRRITYRLDGHRLSLLCP
jgi:hypothetical protein